MLATAFRGAAVFTIIFVRILASITLPANYFISCFGLLAALFPTPALKSVNAVLRGCQLVLVQGVQFCQVQMKLLFHVHRWRKGKSLLNFAQEPDLGLCMKDYFDLSMEFEHGKFQLRYLNAVLGNISLCILLFAVIPCYSVILNVHSFHAMFGSTVWAT